MEQSGKSTSTDWHAQLRRARQTVGLSREAAAARANISPATLKSYELGVRHPTRDSLSAVLSALQVDPLTRDAVLGAAGFAADGLGGGTQRRDPWHSFAEAARATVEAPWPACLTNQFMEVVAANVLMQRVWEDDLAKKRSGPYERSILAMLTRKDIADRLVNWDEAMTHPISLAKGHYGGDMVATREENPYFAGAVDHLLKGDPGYVQRFLTLWMTVPARAEKYRWGYPITWRRSDGGVLRFQAMVNPADEANAVSFNDWIPLDGETGRLLDGLREADDGLEAFVAPVAG